MFLGRYKLIKKGNRQRHFEKKLLREARLRQKQLADHPIEKNKRALINGKFYYPIRKMHESVKQEIKDGLVAWYEKEPMMANFFEKPVNKSNTGVTRNVKRNEFGFLR